MLLPVDPRSLLVSEQFLTQCDGASAPCNSASHPGPSLSFDDDCVCVSLVYRPHSPSLVPISASQSPDPPPYSAPIQSPFSSRSRPILAPRRVKRRANGAFDLVGIELNPGPPKKVVVEKVVVAQPKKKKNKKKGGGGSGGSGVLTLVKGRGDYSTIGRDIGSKLGGALGSLGQRAIQSIFGWGDYKVNRNSLMTGNDPPGFSSGKDSKGVRTVRVVHREYLFDLSGSDAFSVLPFKINPANSSLFPWLSTIADGFEQYELCGMILEFKSTSANALNSTNTALGTVIIATQYNSLEQPFVNKLQMENHEFATSTKPADSAIHPIECAPAATVLEDKYVTAPGANAGDPRFEDLGVVCIATVGMQAAAVIGEVWVSYDICLKKPRLQSATGSAPLRFATYNLPTPLLNLGSLNAFGSGGGFPAPSLQNSSANSLNLIFPPNTSNSFIHDVNAPGNFIVEIAMVFTISNFPGAFSSGSNIVLAPFSGLSLITPFRDAIGGVNTPVASVVGFSNFGSATAITSATLLTFRFAYSYTPGQGSAVPQINLSGNLGSVNTNPSFTQGQMRVYQAPADSWNSF